MFRSEVLTFSLSFFCIVILTSYSCKFHFKLISKQISIDFQFRSEFQVNSTSFNQHIDVIILGRFWLRTSIWICFIKRTKTTYYAHTVSVAIQDSQVNRRWENRKKTDCSWWWRTWVEIETKWNFNWKVIIRFYSAKIDVLAVRKFQVNGKPFVRTNDVNLWGRIFILATKI